MQKYRMFFLLVIAFQCACFGQAFKAATNPEKIIAELKKSSLATNSIQAEFKEEKHLAILKEPKISSGQFFYKKNDKMRWEQQLPFKYVILINGDRLRVQEAGKEKNVASAGRMAAQVKELLIGLVNGDFQENKGFKQSFLESADSYQVILLPVNKRLKNVYGKIEMVFPKTTLRLKELSFFEKGGDKSVMRFQNEKINQPIVESVFQDL
jgi:outer membrane lipoprotein-sorting protein